jgi:hypothetical protein
VQAPDQVGTELFEWYSSPISNRDQRLGSASPFRGRVVAPRWGLDPREEFVPDEFGDVAPNVLDE